MGKGIEIKTSINSRNLLAGITPTFSGWTQNPGTPEKMTDELDNTLTTPGIEDVAQDNTITFDLGAAKRIVWNVLILASEVFGDTNILGSLDGISWYSIGGGVTGGGAMVIPQGSIVKTRYLKFFDIAGTGVTYTFLGFRAYLL